MKKSRSCGEINRGKTKKVDDHEDPDWGSLLPHNNLQMIDFLD